VIGSQAIHGSFRDPDLDVVLRSDDLDIYPRDGYTPMVYEELMLHLGQDSDYHVETGQYLEAVETTLARFPAGWEDRATRTYIGDATIGNAKREVHVVWPEIHDLVVSKLAIRRRKDLEFLQGVIDLGLMDGETLRQRYEAAPRITKERLSEGLTISLSLSEAVDPAFGIRGSAGLGHRLAVAAASAAQFRRCGRADVIVERRVAAAQHPLQIVAGNLRKRHVAVAAERKARERDLRCRERQQRVGVGRVSHPQIALEQHVEHRRGDPRVAEGAVGFAGIGRQCHVEGVAQRLVRVAAQLRKDVPGEAQRAETRMVGEHRQEAAIKRGVVRDDDRACAQPLQDRRHFVDRRRGGDVGVGDMVHLGRAGRDR
jgi:hypothetical protein